RADGHGREVTGVSRELMAEFSSRRQSITELTRMLAVEFRAQHGDAPDARARGKLRQWANHASRRGQEGGAAGLGAEVRAGGGGGRGGGVGGAGAGQRGGGAGAGVARGVGSAWSRR